MNQNEITNPSITRLARKAGVKSIAEECFDVIKNIIEEKMDECIRVALVVNSERQTKTLMVEDIYDALKLLGHNITRSEYLGQNTCNK